MKNERLKHTITLLFVAYNALAIISSGYADWTAPVNISNSAERFSVDEHLDFDENGTIHLGYAYGRYKPFGGSWEPVELAQRSLAGKFPREIYVTSHGTKFYLCFTCGKAYYKVRDNGVWGQKIPITENKSRRGNLNL